MQLLLQSSFLQALAYSLIMSIGQMALLWLAAITLLKSFKFSSAQKFNIAFIAQLCGFILFIYTFVTAYVTEENRIIVGTTDTTFIKDINAVIDVVMTYASILYLGILLFKFVKLLFIFDGTQKLKKNHLKKIGAEQRIFVEKIGELFSIHRKVKIYLSEKILCPLTTGFFKPVILIPVAAVNHLTTQQMEAVILHELAHIKRADYLLYIIQHIIEKIFFFNIFSAMLSEIIERERENACDDWVLQFRYNSMHYAEALFKLGRLKATPVMAMPLQGKKESLLLLRIKRLLHNSQCEAYSFRPLLVGLLSLILGAGLLISPAVKLSQQQLAVNVNTGDKQYLKEVSTIAPVAGNASIKTETGKVVTKKHAGKQLKTSKPEIATQPLTEMNIALNQRNKELELQQNYLRQVKQSIDALQQTIPEYRQAVTAKVQLDEAMLQKALSYKNFTQLEAMLTASGDSISIKESDATKNSYKKLLTIESFDKDGNKHIYSVIVELYQ